MINRTLYVIDDDLVFLSVIEKEASERNIACIAFNKSDTFLKNLNRTMGVVVIDYRLDNGINGIELAKKVLEVNPDCYVILLSAQEDYKVVVEAGDNGIKYMDKNCNDCIEKLFKYIYLIIKEREEYDEKRGEFFDNLHKYLNKEYATN